MTVYVPAYYAGHFGLGLAAVGAAFTTVRLADMFLDPVLGLVMDRTRTRFGRYRAWVIAGAPLVAVPVVLLFSPPVAVTHTFLVVGLLIYYAGASVLTLSHISWASVVGRSYDERSRVFGMIQLVSVLAATLVLIIPTLVGSRDGASDVRAMGWFIAFLAFAGVAVAAVSIREPVAPAAPAEKMRLRDYWDMLTLPDMLRIICADVCVTMGPQWMAASYLFYFHTARGFSRDESRFLLAIYVISGLVGAYVLSRLATRIGKHRTLMVSTTGYSLGLIGLAFLPKAAFAPAAFFMFIMGVLNSSFVIMVRAMVADVGDAVRLEQGRHRIGLLFSMITSAEKIATALSIFLTFSVLAMVGYDAKEGAINTPAAIHGLELVYLIGPIGFVMLGGACLIGYRLNHVRHAEIRRALDERDNGSFS
jgi:Na+/melibiose symporter-like transporter